MKDYGVTVNFQITNISGTTSNSSIFVKRRASSKGEAIAAVTAILSSLSNSKLADGSNQIEIGNVVAVVWEVV